MLTKNNIETEILNILRNNNIPLDEAIVLLGKLIHCSALALNVQPSACFSNLAQLSNNNFNLKTNIN